MGARSVLADIEFDGGFVERQAVGQQQGQRDFGRHWRMHVTMLRAAWALRDGRELLGQLLRLSLVPLGHLFGRLPLGNTGRSNVSAFTPMDVPADLKRLLDDGRG